MNHTDKLILIPIERYEMLKKMAHMYRTNNVGAMTSIKETNETMDTDIPLENVETPSKLNTPPPDEPLSTPVPLSEELHTPAESLLVEMDPDERTHAEQILRHMDPRLWDAQGMLLHLGIPVSDFIKDLMNTKSKRGKPVDSKTRRAWKHFMYKYTSIPPSLVLNPGYVRVITKAKNIKKQNHWLNV